MTFAIGDHDFLLHGKPFRILSGSIHYFRVHQDHWADRIRKARQMGLNTIETYVAWNAHAPREGEFDLSGNLDLGAFLDAVAAEGMYAIVRPGPYICAEWTNGGLPAWLFGDGAGVRQDEPRYMAHVDRYLQQLAPVLEPRQIDRGGPIILVQVENEYGAYGNDKSYLRKLVAINRRIGVTVPLISVDQPVDDMLENGSLPELHRTGSFGSRSRERLDTLRRHQPTGPLMCSEFWDGWFDDWGSHHHLTSVEETARSLDELLERGASVNIYMFHGGTNFGFTNGANDKGTYLPIVTSYDYDAPLDEAGNPTQKYWAMRDVIARYAPVGDEKPQSAPEPPSFTTPLRSVLPLWSVLDVLGDWTTHDTLPTLDSLGHYDGFALYRTTIDVAGPAILRIDEVRDRAQVFLEGDGIGLLARDHHDTALPLPAAAKGRLDLLVEDQGRVDYGPRIGEPKGLIGEASINGEPLRGWSVLPLDLSAIDRVSRALESAGAPAVMAGPVFAGATFDHPTTGDLYLDTSAWGKGVVWINGFCLGRYWSRGPQRTLYVPGPVLRESGNELIVLELQAASANEVSFVSAADLGHTEA
ncbi:beta-galactosidase [Aeromicrobium sp. Root344]|uniref:glycoside hydrolase family 35 protein n=1 Tax=Aeromicrobium sp. Root344 TaxID=1736521 RepID=UPI0006F733E0|nr:beta-galactosidase family protein [Aeromicrobium sp. Root344]KQV76751.1 beta-galactosidase [Aeromicrobium sp. Root344]